VKKSDPKPKPGTSAEPLQTENTLAPFSTARRSDSAPEHPHQNLDRGVRAAKARLSGGVSSRSFIQAWNDWGHHMLQSPGRQLELLEHAQKSAFNLIKYAATPGKKSIPPFEPKRYDHRFNHVGWQKRPFDLWQQGFLAVQDW